MKLRLIRTIVTFASVVLAFFQAPAASAADCDRTNRLIKRNDILKYVTILNGLFLAFLPGIANAGCDINMYFSNSSDKEVIVSAFQVKSKGGVWKDVLKEPDPYDYSHFWDFLYKDTVSRFVLVPGGEFRTIYNATFGCGPRRYKYNVIKVERDVFDDVENRCMKAMYFPSATGWNDSHDIIFGDMGIQCDLPEHPADDVVEGASSHHSTNESQGTQTDGISLPGGPTQGVQLPTSPISLPGAAPIAGSTTPEESVSVPAATDSVVADASAATGQCLVTNTRRFPTVKLRCGLSVRDENVRISEEFLASCPLTAGDMVNVEIDEQQSQFRITGRASGGEWCSTNYPPGYYTGPCFSEKTDTSSTQIRTYFYQGRKAIETVSPKTCNPARLGPGTYRVITETRLNTPDQGSKVEIQETGLRLEGDEMIGDVTGLLPEPITQK